MTTATVKILKAPFPAFGGKSKIADEVWRRFGNPRNYIEPFAFSSAVLLRRPVVGKIETINDLNSYVANFWRAIKQDPEAVADYADWPVNEDDLHARHKWLLFSDRAVNALKQVREDPDYYDAKIAGWWCWGACCWIGSGWCDEQLPHMTSGQGVNRLTEQLPCITGEQGIHVKRPGLCNGNTTAGPGVLAHPYAKRPVLHGPAEGSPGVVGRPQLADAFARGRGVNGNDSADTCLLRRAWLIEWFQSLADRLRSVRVCCGHWSRVCDSPSTLTRLGETAVFLDPPYRHSIDGKRNRTKKIYANDDQDVNALCDEVQGWCLKWGEDPQIKIALCGLEGEYPLLDGWEKYAWQSNGGYGNQSGGVNANARRERILFSPPCKREKRLLF
jgi:site-specific DNA-adenine methylase